MPFETKDKKTIWVLVPFKIFAYKNKYFYTYNTGFPPVRITEESFRFQKELWLFDIF